MTAPRRAFLALVATGLAAPAAAQGGRNLYGDQPPPGSAFLRFVNATGGPVTVRPDFLPAVTLGAGGPSRIGPYGTVTRPSGRALAADLRGADGTAGRAALRAEPGAFLTVILRQAGAGLAAHPVADAASFDQSRAHLAFYNALEDCPAASLSLEGGPAVFADVPGGESRRRTVNPVAASLRGSCGPRLTAPFPLPELEAGGRYSIWLLPVPRMPAEAGPEAFATRDAVPGGWQPGALPSGR